MSEKLDLSKLPPLPPSRSPSPSSSDHSSSGKKTGVKAKRRTAVALVLPDQNAFPSESGKKAAASEPEPYFGEDAKSLLHLVDLQPQEPNLQPKELEKLTNICKLTFVDFFKNALTRRKDDFKDVNDHPKTVKDLIKLFTVRIELLTEYAIRCYSPCKEIIHNLTYKEFAIAFLTYYLTIRTHSEPVEYLFKYHVNYANVTKCAILLTSFLHDSSSASGDPAISFFQELQKIPGGNQTKTKSNRKHKRKTRRIRR